ncbi:high-affinity iron transporter [Roseiarcus fermentans]|uniref:High-affinity iron transporter n=1 Tax=Roseiarcus fermentans TaxID=1473586 RepID=A0A366FGU4_9HYPH|nr:iron uptake transporter permease EfeU [Roseiarcus fermentans]RBP13180.1 high-affinity iron transporter [Roseiarcus fermentans]
MLAPFLIMLREGVEAALIVGIVASYLYRTGRARWMPYVWLGVLLAVALALFAGAAIQIASAEFPQKAQEAFEAVIGLVAVGVLVSMVFWMRRAARSIRGELEGSIEAALATSGGGWALIGMVFFAVAREGLESVFFLLAIFQQSEGAAAPLGALLGLVVAVGVGYAIFVGGVRINLRHFFRWTGVFILVVAAGLLAASARSLHEAGLWNGLQQRPVDLSGILPDSSVVGTMLAGVFNYQAAPALGEILVYVGFLAVTLWLFLRPMEEPVSATARGGAHGDVRV